MKKLYLLLLALVCSVSMVLADSMSVDFEATDLATYSAWNFDNFSTHQTNSNVSAHGGSYFGSCAATSAYAATKAKISSPTSIVCYYNKLTTNANQSSLFKIQVSTNGTDWTDVASGKTMNNVTRGTWEELSADLSSYSDVYVRVYYTGTNAGRTIDDITLTYTAGGDTPDPQPTVSAPTFSPVAGTYSTAQNVTITATDFDYIYYTTDGSSPINGAGLQIGSRGQNVSVNVTSSMTIKAVAYKGSNVSSIAEAAYVISAAPQKTLSSIAVTTQPTKTTYTVGETLDLTGCVVTATYSDASTENVTSSCTFAPANGATLSTEGTQTVTVTYSDQNTSFNVTVNAEQGGDEPSGEGSWTLCSISALTASDIFVIVDANSNTAMTNDNGTSSAPAASEVTISQDGNTITGVTDAMKWNISGDGTNGYTFYPNGSTTTWLYCTATNNGVRVGTNANKTFVIENHTNGEPFLKHSGTSRYVGVYSSQDWRCYTSINSNINATKTRFYKYVPAGKTTPTLSFASATATAYLDALNVFEAPTLTTTPAGLQGVTYALTGDAVGTINASTGALTLTAPGTATITASYAGDGVNYNAAEDATYTLTVNATTPEKTIAEFIASEGGHCYLTGTVSNIVNTTYGNFDLTDESGTIYVYGCLTSEGEAKQFASLDVVVGDKIKVLADDYELYNEKHEAKDVIFVEEIEIVKNNYTVTIETPTNGTLVVKNGEDVLASGAEVEEGTTLTIEVNNNRGYSFRNWQAVDATTHTYTTTFTYEVTANVTIKANFDEITKYTITLADDNTELTPEYGGESIVLPSRADANGYTFAGWSETNVAEETTTAPTIISAGEYLPTATMPMYPVYTRSEAGGSTDVPVAFVVAENLPDDYTTGKLVSSFTLDGHVTATSTGGSSNSGKVYGTSNHQWRFYRTDGGEMTISTTSGTLKSVTVTYSVDKNGVMLHGTDEIASGTTVENINATSIVFTVGGGESATKLNGVIRVTGISVVYTVNGSTTYYISTPLTGGAVTFAAKDGDNYYATFSSNRAVEFGDDVTVYTVTVSDGTMSLNEASKQVPANVGVLLTCENTTAIYSYIASAASLGENMLYAASVNKATLTDHKFYKLAYENSDKENLGFYWGAANGVAFTSREGSAYLAVPTDQAGSNAPVRFVFNNMDTATDIENVISNDAVKFFENGVLYILRDGVRYNALGQMVK